MPADYHFEPGSGTVVITGAGAVTMAERHACVRRAITDPALPPRAGVIIDVSRATAAPAADEIPWVSTLIEWLQGRFGGRVAIVNPVPGHAAVSQLVALLVRPGPEPVQVFPAPAEARSWLGAAP